MATKRSQSINVEEPIQKMDPVDQLKRAKKFIFNTGLNDIANRLCVTNMTYGIAAIHYSLSELDFPANATFIGSPDATITRNVYRWNAGIGYGGKLTWGSGKKKVVFLDVMPNTCGILIGGLEEAPSPDHLIQAVHNFNQKSLYLDDVKIEWDFAKGNHFVDVFRVERSDTNLPPYAFAIHGAAPELRKDRDDKYGLYWHQSPILQELMTEISTPFGKNHVITGKDAIQYHRFCLDGNRFSERRRELVADFIFGDYLVIANKTHQGMTHLNEITLGTHNIAEDMDGLYPMALRADLPAYLFRPIKNLSPEIIENLGFLKRAKRLGVYKRLINANILPHGGGYTFPDLANVVKVIQEGNKRYFVLAMESDLGTKIIRNPREIQFSYRGRSVVLRTIELELGSIAAKLVPLYVVKI